MTPQLNEPAQDKSVFYKCVYVMTALALLYTAYLAQDILLLLLVVGIMSLLLSPGMRLLERLHIPRVLGASVLLCAIVFPAGIFGAQLQGPLSKWAKALPELSSQVTTKIQALNEAIEIGAEDKSTDKSVEEKKKSWFSWFDSNQDIDVIIPKKDPSIIQTRINESLFSVASDLLVSAPFVVIQFLTTMVLILFTLVYSPAIFKHYVALFIAESQRKRVHHLALNVQKQLSKYIVTVSLVNLGLGLGAFLVLHLIGFEDALLIGFIVGFLNFIPYVGPLIGLGLVTAGAYVQWGIDLNVLICVGGILSLNVVESQFVTPVVLAQQMRINPFIIILWLLFCGWMWGLVGVVIAVPLIVCIKLALSQFNSAKKWVALLAT